MPQKFNRCKNTLRKKEKYWEKKHSCHRTNWTLYRWKFGMIRCDAESQESVLWERWTAILYRSLANRLLNDWCNVMLYNLSTKKTHLTVFYLIKGQWTIVCVGKTRIIVCSKLKLVSGQNEMLASANREQSNEWTRTNERPNERTNEKASLW